MMECQCAGCFPERQARAKHRKQMALEDAKRELRRILYAKLTPEERAEQQRKQLLLLTKLFKEAYT